MIPRRKDLQLQPNGYSCGPTALRHAFLAYDMRTSTKTLAKIARTDGDGTTAEGLDMAARNYGYKIGLKRYSTAGTAKLALRNFLDREIPVLLPIERWTHWAVAVYALREKVLILDGQGTKKRDIRKYKSWRDLYTELGVCTGPGEFRFDLYPLVPECISL